MYEREAPLKISSNKMRRQLQQCSSDFMPVDVSYRCPTEEWLIDRVGDVYQQQAFNHGLRVYHREDWDCDERAMLYCTVARGVHRNECWTPEMGLAVGLVSYYVGGNMKRGHAICWAVVERHGKRTVVFIDPGEQPELIKLSQVEFDTLNRFYI